ncbi:MAG: ATPase [Clostridiales bacterium]|nr:ATPase [Clostridiales bacterium]
MKIAVLSGKGGTGKTLIAVNLAALGHDALYLDCDVEEPNGHLFLKPKNPKEKEVFVKIPQVDNELCDGCRKCVDFCAFNALAYVKERLVVFEDICHSCGGCVLLCPQKAFSEKDKPIGKIVSGSWGSVDIHSGFMNVGEASGVPLITELLSIGRENDDALTFIDCPPGSACIVMESIQDADFCVLVAEPTIFGAHNLSMVYELVKLFDKPMGVVLNKCRRGSPNPSEDFCHENKIKILGSIPFDTQLGLLNSNAKIAVEESPHFKELFSDLFEKIKEEATK